MNTDYFADYRENFTITKRAFTQTLPRYTAKCVKCLNTMNHDDSAGIINLMKNHKEN